MAGVEPLVEDPAPTKTGACEVCGGEGTIKAAYLDTGLGRCVVWCCSKVCADRSAVEHPEQPAKRRASWPIKSKVSR